MDAIKFYSVNPDYSFLSNFHPCLMTIDGKDYNSVEHYFQAAKFEGNPEFQEKIRMAATPKGAKHLGKSRDYKITEKWDALRDDVMRRALKEKFKDPTLFKKLAETSGRLLVEDSPYDYYWGIGASGCGQNMLGKLLMELRDRLS